MKPCNHTPNDGPVCLTCLDGLEASHACLCAQVERLLPVVHEKEALVLQVSAMVAENEKVMLERNGFSEKANAADRLNGELREQVKELKYALLEALEAWPVGIRWDDAYRHGKIVLQKIIDATNAEKRNDGLNLGESRNLPFPKPITMSGCGHAVTAKDVLCPICGV